MKLSIIIPVYNEASTISEVIHQVLSVDLPDVEKEIIVVDDGSTDATADILKEEKERNTKTLTIYTSQRNFGKGMAIRTGLKHVTGDIVLIQDADLELDPQEYLSLLEPIRSGRASVVYGSRFLNSATGVPWQSRLAGALLSSLTNLLYRSRLTDEATAYKVFKARALRDLDLHSVGFEFCPEVTAKLLKRGYTIVEKPVTYRPRSAAEGKKIRFLRDGGLAVYTLLRYRFRD